MPQNFDDIIKAFDVDDDKTVVASEIVKVIVKQAPSLKEENVGRLVCIALGANLEDKVTKAQIKQLCKVADLVEDNAGLEDLLLSDADGDKSISKSEFTAVLGDKLSKEDLESVFSQVDADGSQSLTVQELLKAFGS